MYVTCSLGHRHWGTAGAAGGLVVAQGASGTQVLLTLRSAEVHQGNTWSIPGGAIDAADADPHAAACREIEEELGFDVSAMPVIGWHSFECAEAGPIRRSCSSLRQRSRLPRTGGRPRTLSGST
ncbi:MAG: NUDIX hydrolase [Propionibacteriaceae bacterium]|nr:NUDIX hydrolase [Propionibacteriaceae bacterium]